MEGLVVLVINNIEIIVGILNVLINNGENIKVDFLIFVDVVIIVNLNFMF